MKKFTKKMNLAQVLSSQKILCAMLFAITILFSSCSSEEPEARVVIEGKVLNITDNPVRNAQVKIFSDGNELGTNNTDENGVYQIEVVESGSYSIDIEKSGYRKLLTDIVVGQNGKVSDLLLTGEATIIGSVIESRFDDGLPNILVQFFEGSSLSEADTTLVDISATSGSQGAFAVTASPTGNFICVISSDNFYTKVIEDITFVEGTNNLGAYSLIEKAGENEIKVVLTWGASPSDLDFHLTGPVAGSSDRFHLYYGNSQTASSDLDDKSGGYGPETILITSLNDGIYQFSVYNFSNETDDGASEILQSPAQVEVYDFSGKIATYSPPTSNVTGNVWRVFKLTYQSGSMSLAEWGAYDFVESDSEGTNFRIKSDKSAFRFDKNDF